MAGKSKKKPSSKRFKVTVGKARIEPSKRFKVTVGKARVHPEKTTVTVGAARPAPYPGTTRRKKKKSKR